MCDHLIGLKYRRGADGTAGEIDCISLVYRALESLGFAPPPFNTAWYTMTPRQVLRELRCHTVRLDCPLYDGDITLFDGRWPAFGVTWASGLLYINEALQQVDWKPLHALTIRRSYRLKKS